jgi:hypothetical protein
MEILETIGNYGYLPDFQICNAAARAISSYSSSSTPPLPLSPSSQNAAPPLPSITPQDIIDAATANNLRPLRIALGSLDSSSSRNSFSRARNLSKPVAPASLMESAEGINLPGSSQRERRGSVASPRFQTQLLLADKTLDYIFPDLVIDLNNPNGTNCPLFSCRKPLTFTQIVSNFHSNPNLYTVKCPHCNTTEFVPRFTVHSSGADWEGSEGPGSTLWCELLSPWTLRKEVMNVIAMSGIEVILSHNFRNPRIHPQNAVLFWNFIVYFRQFGLPYAFLITEKMSVAFMAPLDD